MNGPRTTASLLAIAMLAGTATVANAQKHRTILNVPYYKQSNDICGAAAAVMLLRYWGARDARPDDFNSLVECTEQGLPPAAFAAAVRARGWQTEVLDHTKDATPKRLRTELDRGYPVIALLREQNENRYVVIVATTSDEVIAHDPKDGPYRVYRMKDFENAWTPSGRWMLVAVPRPSAKPPEPAEGSNDQSDAAVPPTESTTSCAQLIGSAMQAADRDRPGAERALIAATHLCPDDAVAWRELSQLRMRDLRWRSAEHYARRAVDVDPESSRNWDLLARARYFAGDVRGALRAWNHIGQPVTQSVEVHGSRNTDPNIVANFVGINPGDLLTNNKFIRASHRLDDLPVSFDSRLKYAPTENGMARVDVYIDERDAAPSGALPIMTIGIGGLAFQELRFDFASPFGRGEDWQVSWGWERNWRHLKLGVDLPAPGKLPGVMSISGFWEQQVFAPTPDIRTTGDRRSFNVSLADWETSWLRWRLGGGYERFGHRNYGVVQAGLEGRFIRDHAAANIEGSQWAGARDLPTFGAATAWLSTRSTTRVDRAVWYTVFGTAITAKNAPYQLWAGSGANESAQAFLRAHALIRNGVVVGDVFGRRLDFGSIEYNRPFFYSPAGPVAWAAFVDAARAFDRAAGLSGTPLIVDVGVGLRLRPPAVAGVVRFDVARSVTDGRWRASIGLMQKWPRR